MVSIMSLSVLYSVTDPLGDAELTSLILTKIMLFIPSSSIAFSVSDGIVSSVT